MDTTGMIETDWCKIYKYGSIDLQAYIDISIFENCIY